MLAKTIAKDLEAIPVHDHMNSQVQRDRNPGHSCVSNKLGVAEKGGGTMVVGVQKGEGLLLEHEEQGVDEFEVFGQVVKLEKSVTSLKSCRLPRVNLT